jgi:hypothetical protein
MNGNEIPSTGNARVDAALERIRGKFRHLDDALVVQVHLEKRQSAAIRANTEWLEQHEAAKREHEERMKRIELKLEDATDKLNLMIEREMRREGGSETR